MSNQFYRLSNKILLEYIYNDNSLSTLVSTFKKTKNIENNEIYINNSNSSLGTTNNVSKFTGIELSDGKFVRLGIENEYYYPNFDSNFTSEPISFSPNLNVSYDKIRIHLLSGYNFDDLLGFNVSFKLKNTSKENVFLASILHLRGDSDLLYFSPKPKRISQFVYDRYLEFFIPSAYSILQIQNSNPISTNDLFYKFSEGKKLTNNNLIEISFNEILNTEEINGIDYFYKGESKIFSIKNEELVTNLNVYLQEHEDGYFEFGGDPNIGSLENYIFSLNSIAGNNYYLIHEISIIEQVGSAFIETDQMSLNQTDSYGDLKRFRPILRNKNAFSITLDYTLRLYNSSDGSSLIKTGSITSTNVNYYKPKINKINVGGNSLEYDVFNHIISKDLSIQRKTSGIIKNRSFPIYVNSLTLEVKTPSIIKISPFSNIYEFVITQQDGLDTKIYEFDNNNYYFLVFINDDMSKLYIKEKYDPSRYKILFEIPEESSLKIMKLTNKNYYIISRSQNNIETLLVNGIWENQ